MGDSSGVRSEKVPGCRPPLGKPRIGLVQCRPPFDDFTAEEGRVRIARDADDYVESLYAALKLVRERELSFCVFPEYAWPATEVRKLAERAADELIDGGMIIAPFEHLSLNEYQNVLRDVGVAEEILAEELRDAAGSVDFVDRAIVNACVMLVKVGRKLFAYPQRKLRPAQLEEEAYSGRWSFVRGHSVRVFRGEGIATATLICFDFIARNPHDDFEPLRALGEEALTFVFVPECNPSPLHTMYAESLNGLFQAVRPPEAVIFANVAEQTPLPIRNPQLGFSSVVGRIGEATFDPERVVVVDGLVQNKEARSIRDLSSAAPSLPHPEIRTLIIRTEPTVAVIDLPRVGGSSSKNVLKRVRRRRFHFIGSSAEIWDGSQSTV